MPRFICVHSHAFTEEELIGHAQRRGDLPAGLTWRGSWTTTEGIGYCEWEGPDAQAVTNVLEANQIPLQAIHEVRNFDPDAGAFVA